MTGHLVAASAAGERRSLSIAGWVALALPVIGLALLLARPGLDLHWEHQPSHFWLVLATAGLSVVLADVVLCSSGHEHQVALTDLGRNTFEHRLAVAVDDREHLVDVVVHLLADLPAAGDAHHHQLCVRAGAQHPPEVGVVARRIGDRSGPAHAARHRPAHAG